VILSIKTKERKINIKDFITFSPFIVEVTGLEMYLPAIKSDTKKRNIIALLNCLFKIDNIQNIIANIRKVLKIDDCRLLPEKVKAERKSQPMYWIASKATKKIKMVEVSAAAT